MTTTAPTPAPTPPARLLVHAAVVLAACLLLFWPLLGRAGFGQTEGHRVAPAWEILSGSDPLLTRMFERVYLRKPPGMVWAIAASSALLGRTEFAARAVSAAAATVAALVAFVFARRWFGTRAALPAGLAQAIMPVWLIFARTCEIESLHTLACQSAVFLSLDLLLRPAGSRALRALLLTLSLTAAALSKGPAGLPAMAGVLLSCAIAARSWRTLLSAPLWTALALAAAALGAVAYAIGARLHASGQTPVLQDTSDFLPSFARLPAILRLLPAALLEGLPATGAAALALWPGTIEESKRLGPAVEAPSDTGLIARCLALTFLLSTAIFMASGVSNPRYVLPALVPLAPLAGYAWLGRCGLFPGWRKRLAAWMFLGRLWVWPSIGLVLCGWYIVGFMEPQREKVGGRAAGEALAAALPPHAELFADWLVEARPDVLLYARESARARGQDLSVRWVDFDTFAPRADGAELVAVRTDSLGNEAARPPVRSLLDSGWRVIYSGRVYKYSFDVWERSPRPHSSGSGNTP